MKSVIVLILASCLSGCYQSVHNEDIENAALICGGLDKVREINIFFTGIEGVICKNMDKTIINEDALKEAAK
jgi:hypothetical protein